MKIGELEVKRIGYGAMRVIEDPDIWGPPKDKANAHPQRSLTTYLTKLARLGGYLARAHDPPPGNTVMWRGLSRLTDIQLGAIISAQLVGN